ncbi:MAG TPA: SusC/RagA family TonB-linked outer membrane protein [Longimicrobiaceae bacterium]|nr:SusC/RagA family TonB-linked outer membrane protein [Longimicrobiaceae bacterium]
MRKYRRLLAILLAVAPVPATLSAQEPARVSGRVTNTSGAPENAVLVRINALNVGATTGPDGSYTILIPASRLRGSQPATITASRVGLASSSRQVTLTPGATLSVNFELRPDVLQLEGIVATGVGQTTTRERLGVSISSVSTEELNRVQTPNLVNALAAKAPGIEVTSSSGEPGASSYIQIRGVKTIGVSGYPNAQQSGQPLFVVDGVPITNVENFMPASVQYGESSDQAGSIAANRASDINPDDIASIEILKGAAASAIYGARAANGVVLITTKSGQSGQPRATFRTTYSVDDVNRDVPLQQTFGQGSRGLSFRDAADFPNNLRAWGPAVTDRPLFNHWDELFETGHIVDTDFSLSGGTDRSRYYLSLGYSDHQGVIVGENDFYQKVTARLKASHELSSQITLTGNFAYTDIDGSFIQKGSNLSGLLLGGLRTPPDFDNCIPGSCYLSEGGFHRSYTNPTPAGPQDAGVFDNPFFTINENRATSEVGRSLGNVALDYAPANWVNFNYTLGLDYSNDNRLDVLPIGNYTYVPGYLGKAQFLNKQITHNVTGTARREIGAASSGSVTLGYSRESRRADRYFVEGQDFVAPGVFTLANTLTRTPNEFSSRVHVESFFGQVQAELADQLFLTAAVRNDGFSTFGESQPRHWFPKFSAAWEFTETLNLGGSPLSFGKLRAAWGQAGNEPPVYGTVFGFAADEVDSGWNDFLRPTLGGFGGLYSDDTKPQPDLKPERTSEMEAGIDLAFLDERVALGFTWYNARTEDAVLLTPLSPSTGFFFQLQNAATIRNRGVEATVEVRPLSRRDLTWTVGLNFARNRNKVLSLGDPDREFVDMGGFIGTAAVVGEPIGVMRGSDFYRCGRLGENAPAAIVTACTGAEDGALYIDASGFPELDPELRVIGDPHPDWTAGLRSSVRLFESLEISALLDIHQGGDMWNGTRGALYSYGTHGDTEDRATCTDPVGNSASGCTGNELVFGEDLLPGPTVGPGAGTAVPIGQNWYQNGLGSGFSAASAQFIEDASFVKLREVAAAYTVPARYVRRYGMSSLTLQLAGRNLHTWTDYNGADPETNLMGTSSIRGQDYFNNPQTRQFSLSVSLTR